MKSAPHRPGEDQERRDREQTRKRVTRRFWRSGGGSSSSIGYVPGLADEPGERVADQEQERPEVGRRSARSARGTGGTAAARGPITSAQSQFSTLRPRPRGSTRAGARRCAGSRSAGGRRSRSARAPEVVGHGDADRVRLARRSRGGDEAVRAAVRVAVGDEEEVGRELGAVAEAVRRAGPACPRGERREEEPDPPEQEGDREREPDREVAAESRAARRAACR